jgi:trans-aconitate methyltransferase
MSAEAFLTLHRDLPREGPGEPADIAWLSTQITLPDQALICDAACGPGADIAPLLALAPRANVVALDQHPHFIEAAHQTWGSDERVDLRVADMAEPGGSYDLIWCAGAVYFLGIERALTQWRSALAQGGVIAFSEPCFWSDPPEADVAAIWSGYPAMSAAAGIDARVRAAGYETIATRRLSDAAWEDAYYAPLQARMAALRPDADADLVRILNEAQAEIGAWQAYGDEFGYLLSVVRPT